MSNACETCKSLFRTTFQGIGQPHLDDGDTKCRDCGRETLKVYTVAVNPFAQS